MKQGKKYLNALAEPFQSENGLDKVLLLVFLIINGLVLVNASLHDPRIGYDAGDHIKYIRAFAKMHLVTPDDSREFFSPPLPYAFPAALIYLTGMKELLAARLAQYLNVVVSLGLTWYLLKTCQLIHPKSSLRLGTLVFLGILPVYYKTFAFVRGEPYVAFFAVMMVYYVVLIFAKERFTITAALCLGGSMGLCALSRQWGILLFPSVYLFLIAQWIRLPRKRVAIAKIVCLSLLMIGLTCGWFYLFLQIKFGSATAFNRTSQPKFSFYNQPKEFYTGLSLKLLFTNPLRPNYRNQLFPIFYSETWGDYWGYFTVYGKDKRTSEFVITNTVFRMILKGERPDWLETNYETIGAYLGRVNLIAIYPSLLAFVAIVMAVTGLFRRPVEHSSIVCRKEFSAFLLLALGTTMTGYLWFLIMYPIGKGSTIKASYVLQVFPLLAILAGILIEHIRAKSQRMYYMILSGLCVTFVHNLGAMITRYQLYRLP